MEIPVYNANCVDSDKTLHSAASDLSLHCLLHSAASDLCLH